ncbi:MAG: AAA family ATPase [Candidatus Methylumidiphilus sp.]
MIDNLKVENSRVLINNLKIQNFRILQDFEVRKLGRINLIVGKNNSGKSTVLEALRIFAGRANPILLEQIATEHDEKGRITNNESMDKIADLPFKNFFTGRVFPITDDIKIYIGETDPVENRFLEISHRYFEEYEVEEKQDNGQSIFRTKSKIISKNEIHNIQSNYLEQFLVIENSGTKGLGFIELDDSMPGRLRNAYWDSIDNIPYSFVPTQFVSVDDLADIWDNILFSDYASSVKQGLAIIAEDFEDLGFVKSESVIGMGLSQWGRGMPKLRSQFRRTCKVKLKNQNLAVPLNSLGDGMLRVLQLMLKIFPAKGGFLLIDEFENGLHYTIQEKVWRLIFDLAEKLDIQVFATTHSWDCIESFAKVAVERTDVEGVLFRVGRSIKTSDQGKVIATVFEEDKLFSITQAEVEVR